MKQAIIGVDLGGTNIKSVMLGARGMEILNRRCTESRADRGVNAVVTSLATAIRRQQGHARRQGWRAAAVGVGSAGLVDRGVVRNSPNLPGWQGAVPLLRLLRRELGDPALPVVIENDVNCMVLAEQRLGAARGRSQVVGLTLGTGVGGGIIVDGRLYRGSRGGAGELGHMVISEDGPPCLCGNRGCLEALVGARAIVARYRALRPRTDPSSLLTVADIAASAKRGDRGARAALRETGRLLGAGLATIVNIFDPEMIVIGGGVAGAGALILGPAASEMRRRAMPYNAARTKVRRARLGMWAGAIGAALAAAGTRGR